MKVGEKSLFADRRPMRTQSLEAIVSRPSVDGEVPIAAVVPMSSPLGTALDHYAQQVKDAKQLWDDGTIDEDEFKEMKQEAKDEKARRLNEINAIL